MDAASVSNNAAAQGRRALLVDRDSYPEKCVDQPGFAHEPAPKFPDAAASVTRMRAYDEYDAAQAIAYQTPNGINGAGSRGPVGPTLGDICTVRGGAGRFGKEGSPGTYQRVDGELVCVAVARSKESTSVTMKPSPSAKPEIYDQRVARLGSRAPGTIQTASPTPSSSHLSKRSQSTVALPNGPPCTTITTAKSPIFGEAEHK